MSEKPENPWAFPTASDSSTGMTLRDYHAAHCPMTFETFLRGLSPERMKLGVEAALKAFAEARGQYADAMLAEREGK